MIKRPKSHHKLLFLFSPGDSAEKLKGGEEKCGEKKINIKRATTYCIYYGSRIFRRFPPTLFSSFEPWIQPESAIYSHPETIFDRKKNWMNTILQYGNWKIWN